ncbi:isochorismatase family protein [Pectinatus frisingensis]|jgi:nicotinamidase-related amidase|uniref:isochorismatase family protein n=1 Tax=Pectinatus frisingensis TaxID=865 RepID=UPI0018C5EA05|nr:isochorismatase family protein [Pectinatus frisingensis]
MKNEILILIDIQNMYFAKGAYRLHEPEKTAKKAAIILKKFRNDHKPIIHIKHMFNISENPNGDYLLEFNEAVMPQKDEVILTKNYPNAFFKTDLKNVLDGLQATNLVIIGMMSHMCIDTTVRAAQNYNYKIIVVDDACTTMDLKWKGEKIAAKIIHNSIMASLNGVFADVVTATDYLYTKNI